MAVSPTYVGTWEEIKRHDAELKGRRVSVSILPEEAPLSELSRAERLLKVKEMIVEFGKDLPVYPDRKLTLDDYYPDED
ncbi:hypothetical protein EON79_09440 [bacterium]|nr:MAG: hypothetical protein EON79_09440 [bacterium]